MYCCLNALLPSTLQLGSKTRGFLIQTPKFNWSLMLNITHWQSSSQFFKENSFATRHEQNKAVSCRAGVSGGVTTPLTLPLPSVLSPVGHTHDACCCPWTAFGYLNQALHLQPPPNQVRSSQTLRKAEYVEVGSSRGKRACGVYTLWGIYQ